jgi:peptidoglycan/LPS O-acetylase OafA/YrhL
LIAGQFFFVQTSAFAKNIIGKEINIYGYFNYAIAFLVGALCNIYKKKIVAKPFWLLIVGLLLALFYFYPLIALALIIVPLFNIFFATRQSVFLKRITPSADLSYGIYVFGFPIQQIIAVYFHPQNTWIFFFLSVLFVLPFAFFSWHVVEKKALRFKYLVR